VNGSSSIVWARSTLGFAIFVEYGILCPDEGSTSGYLTIIGSVQEWRIRAGRRATTYVPD
jgi:hypothetical protein